MQSKTIRIGAAMAAGIMTGSVINVVAASADNTPSASASKPAYAKNAQGQTFGVAGDVAYEDEPDLIQAVGVDGTEGYVRKADLDGPGKQPEEFTSPQEAVEAQRQAAEAGPRSIPLYASDGKTVLGEFIVQAP